MVARSNRAGVAEHPGAECRESVLSDRASSPRIRDTPMAVGATHLALRDLGFDLRPRITCCDHRGYIHELLSRDVIELEDDRVSFAAIDTWMRHVVGEDRRAIERDARRLVASDPQHLAVVVALMAFGLIRGETGLAPRLQTMGFATPSRKLCPRFQLAALATAK
ncbi:MAG TPA: hypothetical protein VI814_13390 [Candidatus Limnocylindria bacterium]